MNGDIAFIAIEITDLEAIVRLLLAAALGVIGLEREAASQSAGERTHALVSLASGAFTLLSITAFAGADMSRVAAGTVGMAIGSGNYLLGIVTAVIAGAILLSERVLRIGERLTPRQSPP